MTSVTQHAFLSEFRCLGAECPDNCCNSWTVLADQLTLGKWKNEAPELLDFIEEKPGLGCALKFDKTTGLCPKLENGWCGIHKKYGETFLTDTCHLYPRITRGLGDATLVSASISCPEIARLIFMSEQPFALRLAEAARIPSGLKQYLPEGLNQDEALALHQHFMHAAVEASAEQALMRMAAFAHRYNNLPLAKWPQALSAGWKLIDRRIPTPQPDRRDPFFLLIVLATLIKSTGIAPSGRLQEVIAMMERSLACELLWEQATVNTQADSFSRAAELQRQWHENYAQAMQPILSRILQSLLAACHYPYAGIGEAPVQKMAWIASHYATIRLGLMVTCDAEQGMPPPDKIIQIAQTITRVLEHLGDLNFALPMYEEAGWLKLDRVVGLLLTQA